ncbi:hypothetical protein GCM10008023_05660 [Sphingomonas glacialis]|uniref:HNH nuclease domain-containing protein n=1 Tax=Sphingomonas glacialis TaxID=658225 RepID=A0ABQ3L941_9SPHN|nr:HNH endonuclease [Sphingomonas glacialis]GHH09246.1 hypothetical protein GCM10008023_05660 [Sphingomonas glacialis]
MQDAATLPEKLQRFSISENGCWNWNGSLWAKSARPRYWDGNGKWRCAYRAIYAALAAPIPEGLTLDHLCMNKACVNPGHLEPVSMVENRRRYDASNVSKPFERVRNNKITEEQAVEIVRSPLSNRECAARFGLSSGNVSRIRTGKRWGYATAELRAQS